MKAALLTTALVFGLTNLGWSAVTLRMSSTSVFATNFLSKTTGDASTTMVWGIVVDTDDSGFKGLNPLTPYNAINLTSSVNPLVLSTTTDGTDSVLTTNVLYLSSGLMTKTGTSTVDGLPAGGVAGGGLNRIGNLSNFNYLSGVTQGDKFMVIWFDVNALGGAAAKGVAYGMADVPGAAFRTMPADPGTHDWFGGWVGPDEAKPMNMALGTPVPETSTVLLGALGAIGLLRRRR